MILRHAIKCDDAEPGCAKNNEALTAAGERQAMEIGNGVRRTLGGRYTVHHSSMVRTRDTALLAFHKSTGDPGISKPCLPGFADHIRNLPVTTNMILVTHSSCIDSLENADGERHLGFKSGNDDHFGIAAFMEQSETGSLRVIGCVWPHDWTRLGDSGASGPAVRALP